MTAVISHITIDCTNAYELSEWWKAVLGYNDLPDDPNNPGDVECIIVDSDSGQKLLFIEVPDFDVSTPKRIHFDLRPATGRREDELRILLGLGAVQLADHRGIHGPGTGWVVLADPEGNQFCILRAEHEYAEQA